MNEFPLLAMSLAQVILLSAAVPLSLIAYRGFAGTPWGGVLLPLPVLEAAFALGLSMYLIGIDTGIFYFVQAVLFGIGVVATLVFTYRLAQLVVGGVAT